MDRQCWGPTELGVGPAFLPAPVGCREFGSRVDAGSGKQLSLGVDPGSREKPPSAIPSPLNPSPGPCSP